MTILTLRTDKPEAELALYNDDEALTSLAWEAHRRLAETIHQKIREVLEGHSLTVHDLEGVVVFRGPGSFTGLRIGSSVANALAEGLQIPIVCSGGESWQDEGCARLVKGENDRVVIPEYGSPPHVTQQKR